MNITSDIRYIGVNDRAIDLFEGQYTVPNGMAYNSYAIIDEKIAITDTVDARFGDEWLANIREALGDRAPDYLIVQHMEPDHSSNITRFAEAFPNAVICASQKAFAMMKSFFGVEYAQRRMILGEGAFLSLGKHELTFLSAPMVHWPEVIVTYDRTDRILFSADAFGKFGALDADEPWIDEARRYYIGIVGKYGPQVLSLLSKAKELDIRAICPLHGPALTENLSYYLGLYTAWASYTPETKGVLIAYTSIYGNTKRAALALAERLTDRGLTVSVRDLARCDIPAAVADAFRFDCTVLATTTYNNDIFPPMRAFLSHLTERGFKNRTVAFVENGSWAPTAAKTMRAMLEGCKELRFCEPAVRILSAPTAETYAALDALAEALSKSGT